MEFAARAIRSAVSANDNHSETDNCSTDAIHDSGHAAHSSPATVLFLFAAFAVGGEPLLLEWAFAETLFFHTQRW